MITLLGTLGSFALLFAAILGDLKLALLGLGVILFAALFRGFHDSHRRNCSLRLRLMRDRITRQRWR